MQSVGQALAPRLPFANQAQHGPLRTTQHLFSGFTDGARGQPHGCIWCAQAELLNPEGIDQIRRALGLTVRDGYGQTETRSASIAPAAWYR